MDWEFLLSETKRFQDDIRREHDTLQTAHPSLTKYDARLISLVHVSGVIDTLRLDVIFLTRYLFDDSWWDTIKVPPFSLAYSLSYINEYKKAIKFSFIVFLVSSIENSFRVLLRAIDSGACNGGTADFKSIYETLLRTKLSTPLIDYIDLLDLLRHIRNTVHNNSVYFHKNGLDQQVSYRGVTYKFQQGKAVDFLEWSNLLPITADAIELLARVVSDPSITRIGHHIEDPYME